MGDFHELRLEFRRVWSPVQVHPTGTATGTHGRLGTARTSGSGAFSSRVSGGSGTTSAIGTPGHSRSVVGFGSPEVGGATSPEMEISPGARFCHVGVVYDSAFYIFGGYDGNQR